MAQERRRTGYVLGLNLGWHESSAALARHGALRWLVEQERLSRRKRALGQLPAQAARACLQAEGIELADVDAVAIGWDFSLTRFGRSRRFTDEGLHTLLFEGEPSMPPVRWIAHHRAHAASAYWSAGMDDVAILVVDGAGETQSTTVAHGRDGRIELLREWPVSQSLGFVYASASKWAGLGEWGSGKLMGLAAYGRARDGIPVERAEDGYRVPLTVEQLGGSERGAGPRMPLLSFPPEYERAIERQFATLFPYAKCEGDDATAYADFAASVQRALEEAMLGLAIEAKRLTGAPVLALVGGVAMNCSMIGRLAASGLYERIFVPPVSTDSGVSLGAALAVASEHEPFEPTRLDHAYWSLPLDPGEAAAAIEAHRLPARQLAPEDLTRHVAAELAAGKIVAWARGRGEIGQRALGARSILADPRDRRSLERLNRIKGREMWRPVAPSVLAEHATDLFQAPVGEPTRFMLCATQVRPDRRTAVPAVTHVDGSARPQLVERDTNPAYWELIDAFRALTAIPALVNTSFNLAGEPIVCSGADAVSTFLRADGIELLVLENFVVTRPEDRSASAPARDSGAVLSG
ncbi:MAG: carbamoyltransferase [Solirubrobacteraceae bacterium]